MTVLSNALSIKGTGTERVALIIVRAWQEGDDPTSVRAQTTWVADLRQPHRLTMTDAGIDAILRSVHECLEELAR